MNNNRTTKHRLVKDKQKQIDNSAIPQAVYLWLTNELGYRSGRSTSIVDDVIADKEITKEDIQKYDILDGVNTNSFKYFINIYYNYIRLCKNEFIPIFTFLMEHVKSIKYIIINN